MSNLLSVIILAAALLLAGTPGQSTIPCEDVLSELDRLIKEEDHIIREKEARIQGLHAKLAASPQPRQRYCLLKELYDEYARFNLDSALHYAHAKEELARKLADRTLINDALKDKADRYIISGMYRYAEDALGAVQMDERDSPQTRVAYYRSLITLHHNINLSNKDTVFKKHLDHIEHQYRDMIFNVADTTMLYYYTYRAENELDKGRPDVARRELERYLNMDPTNPDELSILHYCIAKTYRREGDNDRAFTHYAISARYDLSTGVRSSRSLIQTARYAMFNGQIDRAFAYITHAYNGATLSDARVCLEEISDFMSEIIASYDLVNKQRFNAILVILVLLAMLLAGSIISIVIIRRYQKAVLRYGKITKSINSSLKLSLEQLKKANEIRETTLGRYAAMFSSHINSLEEYRSFLRVLAKSHDIKEIIQALRSDEFIDAKRESLLKEFDHTFLTVFPDFISELNSLLQEDQRIGQDLPPGKMTNEIRIFALIRLGVKESSDIARFLKKSPSTIYNYRVKLRNASIYPNEEFDKRLQEIGKPVALP